jgi:DNA-binding MarR family transcriptional regulator
MPLICDCAKSSVQSMPAEASGCSLVVVTSASRRTAALNVTLLHRIDRQLQRDSGLSAADYVVLASLNKSERGRMRVLELAATLQWEKSRVSKHLGRMVARGLLTREPCATDQRGAVIVLTDTGRRAFAGAQPVHLTHLRKLLIDALSTEQLNTFGELAEIILTHIDALDRDHDGEDAEEVAGRTGV